MEKQELEDFLKDLQERIQEMDTAMENLEDCYHGIGYALAVAGPEIQKLLPASFFNWGILPLTTRWHEEIRPNLEKHLK